MSENPVYIQGDWNANAANDGFTGAHAATSVIADAVTLLSNSWNDNTSFTQPYAVGQPELATRRLVSRRDHRRQGPVVPAAGRARRPTSAPTAARTTSCGIWRTAIRRSTIAGSMATFFYNRQAVGTYKCCTTVYGAPTRNYNFDIDFLNPALLPPNTPVFRDMNAVGFSQELRPGK